MVSYSNTLASYLNEIIESQIPSGETAGIGDVNVERLSFPIDICLNATYFYSCLIYRFSKLKNL